MITNVYTILDNKTGVYNRPFHQVNEQEVLRTCTQLINDPSQQPSQTPEDFSLWSLGTYDDNTGMFELNPAPEHVVNLIDLVKPNAQ